MDIPKKKTFDLKNEFSSYYMRQGVIESEEECAHLLSILQTPLPSCFRINPNSSASERIEEAIKEKFNFPNNKYFFQDIPICPPRRINWYPNKGTVWQLDCGRHALNKAAKQHPEINDFHEYLSKQTSYGNLSRQELVSMIPPLLLHIEKEHIVLDMCAAPGSKTAQIIEALSTFKSSSTNAEESHGFVVANDADQKRAFTLAHQAMRLDRQLSIVTCHLGELFPGLYNKDGHLSSSQVFDRILCDVPCSGDGTIRKNPAIWKTWHVANALTLHKTQVGIALRGACLLKVNGLMVYSTCSLNPIENEAVVGHILEATSGSLELVDCSKELKGLIRRPGLVSWEVAWKKRMKKIKNKNDPVDLIWMKDDTEIPDFLKDKRIFSSMFPSPTWNSNQATKCLRVLPHDQNTGGFFIAVLRKVKPIEKESYPLESTTFKEPEEEDDLSSKWVAGSHRLEDMSYLPLPLNIWNQLQEYYGILPSFPKERLFTRSSKASTISLVAESVIKNCLINSNLRVITTGNRIFNLVSGTVANSSIFRPSQEGLKYLVPHVTKRKAYLTQSEFNVLLHAKERIPMTSFCDQTVEQINNMNEGPIIVMLQDNIEMGLVVWKGQKCLTILLAGTELEILQTKWSQKRDSSY